MPRRFYDALNEFGNPWYAGNFPDLADVDAIGLFVEVEQDDLPLARYTIVFRHDCKYSLSSYLKVEATAGAIAGFC